MCTTKDPAGTPLLICGLQNGSLRIYTIPRFDLRTEVYQGGIGHKLSICTIKAGPAGFFFTGSVDGRLVAWQLKDDQ